jgi:hypothetical protein
MKRFNDTAMQVAIAAGIFEPKPVDKTPNRELTISSLTSLCMTFMTCCAVKRMELILIILAKTHGIINK